jgi:hypothetical protein
LLNLSRFNVPPLSRWQDFEDLCYDLWRGIWRDPGTQKNGRLGQPQHGVDVYGKPNRGELYAGLQCKGKKGYSQKGLTEKQLRDAVREAEGFTPRISDFIMATTAPRDQRIQEIARLLTEEREKTGLFGVTVCSWDDIVGRLGEFPDVLKKHYPELIALAKVAGPDHQPAPADPVQVEIIDFTPEGEQNCPTYYIGRKRGEVLFAFNFRIANPGQQRVPVKSISLEGTAGNEVISTSRRFAKPHFEVVGGRVRVNVGAVLHESGSAEVEAGGCATFRVCLLADRCSQDLPEAFQAKVRFILVKDPAIEKECVFRRYR